MSTLVATRSNPPQDGPLWRLSAGQVLRRHAWQGDYVLYNDISGDTHMLDEGAMRLLLRLQAGPAAHGVLLEVPYGADSDDLADAAALLGELETLVLIEPVA